jgi:choline dehydrogenase-like flavoprotein
MRRDQLEHAIRTACQIAGLTEVIIVGSQAILGTFTEDERGTAQSWLTEALFNMPVTAHILGGAVAADTPEHGVVDDEHRVFGYQNLLVCDGSVIPANPGVKPSLTITAMAERAMTTIPVKPGSPTIRARTGSISSKRAAV